MSFLPKSFKLALLSLVAFFLFPSPALARILVQDGIKLPLVAVNNAIDSQIQGKVLVNTKEEAGEGISLPESPSAWEIIRSRSLWQERDQLEEEEVASPAGFNNLLDEDQRLLDLGQPDLVETDAFTNPSFQSNSGLSEEEAVGLVDSALDEFTSRPVSFSEALEVLGAVSLASTSVSGPLVQDGTLMMTDGKNLDVIGETLYLQSEGLGAIDFIAGKMKLDREGNLVISGGLEVGGGVKTDFISPLASDGVTIGHNLVVQGETRVNDLYSQGTINSQFLTVDQKTQLTGPVDIQGNLTATDYARVGDLIIDRGLKILDQGESGTVGTATIYAGTYQVEVPSTRVMERSKIFITLDLALGEVGPYRWPELLKNPELFVFQKVPGSHFIVATNELLEQDLTFNWLLIN